MCAGVNVGLPYKLLELVLERTWPGSTTSPCPSDSSPFMTFEGSSERDVCGSSCLGGKAPTRPGRKTDERVAKVETRILLCSQNRNGRAFKDHQGKRSKRMNVRKRNGGVPRATSGEGVMLISTYYRGSSRHDTSNGGQTARAAGRCSWHGVSYYLYSTSARRAPVAFSIL